VHHTRFSQSFKRYSHVSSIRSKWYSHLRFLRNIVYTATLANPHKRTSSLIPPRLSCWYKDSPSSSPKFTVTYFSPINHRKRLELLFQPPCLPKPLSDPPSASIRRCQRRSQKSPIPTPVTQTLHKSTRTNLATRQPILPLRNTTITSMTTASTTTQTQKA
jgi:hypothetical protein